MARADYVVRLSIHPEGRGTDQLPRRTAEEGYWAGIRRQPLGAARLRVGRRRLPDLGRVYAGLTEKSATNGSICSGLC